MCHYTMAQGKVEALSSKDFHSHLELVFSERDWQNTAAERVEKRETVREWNKKTFSVYYTGHLGEWPFSLSV